jgi:hypothetical protein
MMEHLNFCRSLTKQFAAMVEVPGLDGTERARMNHAMDLAAASQKFLLPDGGLLMDDPELRAIDGTLPLRLPHQFLALEFLHADDEDRPDVLTKRIVFARERDQFVHLSGAGCPTHDAVWTWLPECAIPMQDYLDRSDPSGRATVHFRPLAPWEAGPDCYPLYLKVLMCFLNALACSNVHVARSEPRKAGRKVKAALPFDTYHVLTIDVPGRPGERSGIGGAHRSPREHLRRGHIRRLGDGRRIWVNATVVAAGRGGGTVTKDYALRAAA